VFVREVRAVSASTFLEDRVFAELKRLCYAGLDEETLLREVPARLRRAVPFDAYCAHTVDPSSNLITRAVSVEAGGEKVAHHFLEHVYFENDINTFEWMAQNRVLAARLSETTGGRPDRALRYRELMRPIGLGHELRAVLTADMELWGAIDMLRASGSLDFDTREVGLLNRLAPHFGAGLRVATLRSQATFDPEGVNVPGILILDHRERVMHYTAAAERWLREIDDLGPGWREGEGLPAPVWVVVGALRRALRPETDRDLNSVPRLFVRARSGRWLTFQADLTEPHLGHEGEIAVVIEPAGTKEVAWLRTTAYGLSPREREIADLVVRGASTKQIAATLYISEYTVQDHLSNIFEKVGVRNRRALVKQLYLSTLFS
jgi:DNA-binding CsgD family transcriptional regulator